MAVFKCRESLPHLAGGFTEVVPNAVRLVLLPVSCLTMEDDEQEHDKMWELPIEMYISFFLSKNQPPILSRV